MPQQVFAVSCSGMAQGKPPETCVVVIFGVAGDLARNMLIPALFDLGCQGLLPEPFAIIGVARRPWNDDQLRQQVRDILQERKGFRNDVWQQFEAELYYERGDFSDPVERFYTALRERIGEVRAAPQLPDNILFHLSIPPSLYGDVVQKLATASLLKSADGGWRRVIIEKPFGHDEATARSLDDQLLDVMAPQIDGEERGKGSVVPLEETGSLHEILESAQ